MIQRTKNKNLTSPPKYSIVIPLYNKELHITKTLESVIDQSFKDFEIIVVNDGSTDDSKNKVQSIEDLRIRIIDQKNSGVSAARNRGILEARGEFIAFLDADDEWDQEYIDCIDFLTSSYPECNVFACSWAFKDENKIHRPRFKHIPAQHGILENFVKSIANGDSPLWTSAIVIRKNILLKNNLFDTGTSMGEDIDLWYRLSKNNKISFYNKTLSYYNRYTDNRLCNKKLEYKPLPFVNQIKLDIDLEKNAIQKFFLKKFLARSFHNVMKNLIKQGDFHTANRLIFQAPLIPNMELLKCFYWYIYILFNHIDNN